MTWVKSIPPKMMHEQFGVFNGLWMKEMDRAWKDCERGYDVCSRMIYTKQWGNVEHVTITRITDEVLNMGGSAPIGWA